MPFVVAACAGGVVAPTCGVVLFKRGNNTRQIKTVKGYKTPTRSSRLSDGGSFRRAILRFVNVDLRRRTISDYDSEAGSVEGAVSKVNYFIIMNTLDSCELISRSK